VGVGWALVGCRLVLMIISVVVVVGRPVDARSDEPGGLESLAPRRIERVKLRPEAGPGRELH
jgi:hypothetical protein